MRKTWPIQIDVAISTVDRPKNYVHQTVAYLPKNLPLRLIVGSPHYSYLERYRQNRYIEIIGLHPSEWLRFKNYPVQHRSSWNYWRCFVNGVRPGRRKGLLILEDDVRPAKGWEKQLYETIEQIESQYGQEYVLSLYTAFTELPKYVVPGQNYIHYPAYAFGGTQAMYYPEPIRVAFAEYLRKEGVEVLRMPYDWLLNEYLRLTGIRLFLATPLLFQHIGEVSTGLSLGFHRAAHFEASSKRKK